MAVVARYERALTKTMFRRRYKVPTTETPSRNPFRRVLRLVIGISPATYNNALNQLGVSESGESKPTKFAFSQPSKLNITSSNARA